MYATYVLMLSLLLGCGNHHATQVNPDPPRQISVERFAVEGVAFAPVDFRVTPNTVGSKTYVASLRWQEPPESNQDYSIWLLAQGVPLPPTILSIPDPKTGFYESKLFILKPGKLYEIEIRQWRDEEVDDLIQHRFVEVRERLKVFYRVQVDLRGHQ